MSPRLVTVPRGTITIHGEDGGSYQIKGVPKLGDDFYYHVAKEELASIFPEIIIFDSPVDKSEKDY